MQSGHAIEQPPRARGNASEPARSLQQWSQIQPWSLVCHGANMHKTRSAYIEHVSKLEPVARSRAVVLRAIKRKDNWQPLRACRFARARLAQARRTCDNLIAVPARLQQALANQKRAGVLGGRVTTPRVRLLLSQSEYGCRVRDQRQMAKVSQMTRLCESPVAPRMCFHRGLAHRQRCHTRQRGSAVVAGRCILPSSPR